MSKTVLLQAIQFSISTQFNSIQPIDWILSSASTRARVDLGAIGSKGVLRIPQSSSITGISPSNWLVSPQGWLDAWVYGISTLVSYLITNPFSTNNHFYFKKLKVLHKYTI